MGAQCPHQLDVIISTWPGSVMDDAPADLLPPSLFQAKPTVLDVAYAPGVTRLLALAGSYGCQLVSGWRMFLHQAIAQCQLWTGRSAAATPAIDHFEKTFMQ
eukprot:TRINITY_DN5043_c0_g1_i4.p1 TRINITY_DN5043_c0_g1~~TRINITY_DN5043_c0_g1_i4.p1  ORF type:complete len:111 (+),score=32.60 TRINITY_DN5043_c0_g1_i4:29-334(+)